MFNDLFWFSMIVAAFGSTALVVAGIALPACPTGPSRHAGDPRPRDVVIGRLLIARPRSS